MMMHLIIPEILQMSQCFLGLSVPLLIRLSLPILAGMFFQLLYNIVDTWFVSRIDLTDPSYVGGVGLIFPLIFLFIALGNGIMVGISSLVARAIGEENRSVLNRTAESGLFIALIITILSMSVAFIFGKTIVQTMGAQGDYFKHGYNYLIFVTPAALFIFFGNVFIGILQGEGLMKHVMNGMILGTLINIVLDPVFIFILKTRCQRCRHGHCDWSDCLILIYFEYFFKKPLLHSYRVEIFKY